MLHDHIWHWQPSAELIKGDAGWRVCGLAEQHRQLLDPLLGSLLHVWWQRHLPPSTSRLLALVVVIVVLLLVCLRSNSLLVGLLLLLPRLLLAVRRLFCNHAGGWRQRGWKTLIE